MIKVYGPYKRIDGRKIIILYNKGKRKTVSYPKYIYQKYYGIKLKNDETIDHIDGDYTNDLINNLQILSRNDNIKKSLKTGESYSLCKCFLCNNSFWRLTKIIKGNQETKKRKGPFCSRQCAGKYNAGVRKRKSEQT